MGTPDRGRRGLGQSQVSDLAGFDKFGHRTHSVFDRSFGVDAVLIVQIDMIDAEPLQRGIARASDILRLSANRPGIGVFFRSDVRKLRGQKYFVAAATDCFPDKLFVVADPINVCRIEEVDSEVERTKDSC
jgi:hypothetical protein